MDDLALANRFDRERPRLRAVAYRILGPLSDADDAVQETWLRLQRTRSDQIDNLAHWLTTVLARICLNMLRTRSTQGEQPLDRFLREPLVSPATGDQGLAMDRPPPVTLEGNSWILEVLRVAVCDLARRVLVGLSGETTRLVRRSRPRGRGRRVRRQGRGRAARGGSASRAPGCS
jgi:DNA-directed RNA polymerase specialized sigma24 family protein